MHIGATDEKEEDGLAKEVQEQGGSVRLDENRASSDETMKSDPTNRETTKDERKSLSLHDPFSLPSIPMHNPMIMRKYLALPHTPPFAIRLPPRDALHRASHSPCLLPRDDHIMSRSTSALSGLSFA